MVLKWPIYQTSELARVIVFYSGFQTSLPDVPHNVVVALN
jgi:hypothetical protein